jgi:Flp pilus assembly secretin CpaC
MTDMSKTESASIAGLPGLAELPGFNSSLSDLMKTTDESELVILVTPRLVRRRSNSMASRAIPFHSSVPTEF